MRTWQQLLPIVWVWTRNGGMYSRCYIFRFGSDPEVELFWMISLFLFFKDQYLIYNTYTHIDNKENTRVTQHNTATNTWTTRSENNRALNGFPVLQRLQARAYKSGEILSSTRRWNRKCNTESKFKVKEGLLMFLRKSLQVNIILTKMSPLHLLLTLFYYINFQFSLSSRLWYVSVTNCFRLGLILIASEFGTGGVMTIDSSFFHMVDHLTLLMARSSSTECRLSF